MSLSDRRGMTLIEVIVATAVFALVVFVLSGFYLTASSRGYLGRTETAAALLAQQRLEVLKGKAYASLPGFAATETIDELGTANPDGPFTRITAITTPYLGSAAMTQIGVTMNWLDRDTPRTYTITTVVVNLP